MPACGSKFLTEEIHPKKKTVNAQRRDRGIAILFL
jgi:hypothetical protein